MGLVIANLDSQLAGVAAGDLVDFITVSSAFYPPLQGYHEDAVRRWREAVKERDR